MRGRRLALPPRPLAADEPQRSALWRDRVGDEPSLNPTGCAGCDVTQLDQRGHNADRGEADDNVRPSLVGDEISDQHRSLTQPLPETPYSVLAAAPNEATAEGPVAIPPPAGKRRPRTGGRAPAR